MMFDMVDVSLNRDRIAAPKDHETSRFDCQDLERLGRFQTRTVLTIGTARTSQVYQNELMKLACLHPYLMHVVQTITAIHDRYLSAPSSSNPSTAQSYHWSQAAALFNKKLSAPIQPSDRDALWATAVLLGAIAFSSIEASKPEDAWPLKSSSVSDLEWLNMVVGKHAIWKIADPLRKDSVFQKLSDARGHDCFFSVAPGPEHDFFLSAFTNLCNLSIWSTSETNPYYAAVHSLAPLLDIECDQSTLLKFLSFLTCYMNSEFRDLLERKDPRAMLLLAYWYAKVCRSQWWIARRAMLECQAICIHLERYHGGDAAIQDLLLFPKMRCGLVV